MRRAHGSCLQLRGSEQSRESSAETEKRAFASLLHLPVSLILRARVVGRCFSVSQPNTGANQQLMEILSFSLLTLTHQNLPRARA